MKDFIEYAPFILNLTELCMFVVVQFFLCRYVQMHRFSASDMVAELFCRPFLIVMPVLLSVVTFIAYEMFVLNVGSDFSAVCMLFAYYVIPAFSIVFFVYYSRKLYGDCDRHASVRVHYIKLVVSVIIPIETYKMLSHRKQSAITASKTIGK